MEQLTTNFKTFGYRLRINQVGATFWVLDSPYNIQTQSTPAFIVEEIGVYVDIRTGAGPQIIPTDFTAEWALLDIDGNPINSVSDGSILTSTATNANSFFEQGVYYFYTSKDLPTAYPAPYQVYGIRLATMTVSGDGATDLNGMQFVVSGKYRIAQNR